MAVTDADIDALEHGDDVHNVYTNIDVSARPARPM
jgi:transcriptional/translational regulatory protein YebC/TACO1